MTPSDDHLPAGLTPASSGRQHVVEFYDSEEFLVGTVAGFVGPALNDGDAAIVVATEAHRLAFEAALLASRVDVAGAVATGRYLAFDAAERLESFMVDGAPDHERFATMVEEMIQMATAGGRRVRIYGEMVSLLWDAGDVVSALALEDLWNGLADTREFMRLCAYPMRSFRDADRTADFRRICDQHSTVIPSERYAMVGGADAQQRVVAHLQQETTVLRADVNRLRAERVLVELAYVEGLMARTDRREGPLATSAPRATRAPAPVSRLGDLHGSPGGRLLVESMGTLTNRLRYTG